MARSKANKGSKLKIIPLGGVDEIGKNMTVYEYEDDMIVVDCGSIFPQEDMLGVDLVIPDTTYIEKNVSKLRGFLITHGHEDHIGATPYVFEKLKAPVYGTRLTLALVDHKLKERRVGGVDLRVIQPHDVVQLGNSFKVEFLHVNHSIAGAVAMAIHTPVGTVIHTGDFKIDYTPVDGEQFDLGRMAQLGEEGVLALLCDSTNVERPGYTMSERTVGATFENLFHDAQGRIIIAMFASNIHRIQQVVDSAVRHNRKVCLCGRSMVNVSKVAMQLGDLLIPEGKLISIDDLDRYSDDEIVVITTGSQGETMSGLTRMAFSEHKKLEIKESDMVIISATPIPGNEKSVSRVINQLVRRRANVIYEALADVHVSGHACQEELKLIHVLTKPKFFIPVHGEARHLHQHARLAQELGMPEKNIRVPELGQVFELSRTGMNVAGTVPIGSIMIDGLGIGDVGNVVLRDRKLLSQDGLIIVVMAIDHELGQVTSGPDIISRGFVYVRESEEMMEGARLAAKSALDAFDTIDPGDWGAVKHTVREEVSHYIFGRIKRSPMILPIIIEV